MKTPFSADFEYQIMNDIVVIYDLNKGNRSVTNDIKNVLNKIKSCIDNIRNKKFIYQDSLGTFDQIITNETGEFITFKSLNEKTLIKREFEIRK